MAKVRIQARSADIETDPEHSAPHTFHHAKSKHPGALDVLSKVLKREGITGWYQVRYLCFFSFYIPLIFRHSLGHAGADNQSRAVSSFTLYV